MTDTTQALGARTDPLHQDSHLGEPTGPGCDHGRERDGAGPAGGTRGVPAARRRRGLEGAHRGDGHVHRPGIRGPGPRCRGREDRRRRHRRVRDHSGGRRRERRRADALRHPRWRAHRRRWRSVPVDGAPRSGACRAPHVGGRLPHAARPPVSRRRSTTAWPCTARCSRSGRPEQIVVGGWSAGGNLAAAFMLRARAEGLPMPEGAAALHAGGRPHRVGRHVRHQRRRRLRPHQPPDRVDRAVRRTATTSPIRSCRRCSAT